MWEPIHIFLYGWWPIVHERNIYQKIINMEVFVGIGSKVGETNSSASILKCVKK
jgi:hypothetical protein